MAGKAKTKTFEERVNQVEATVTRLEGGELPLEEVMSCYASARETLKQLEKELADARQRVTVLRQEPDGSLTEEPMEEEE